MVSAGHRQPLGGTEFPLGDGRAIDADIAMDGPIFLDGQAEPAGGAGRRGLTRRRPVTTVSSTPCW